MTYPVQRLHYHYIILPRHSYHVAISTFVQGDDVELHCMLVPPVLPLQRMTMLPHEDWVSSISCRISQYVLHSHILVALIAPFTDTF